MPKKLLHTFQLDDLIRSVLLSVPIESRCGITKVLTQQDVDAAADPNGKVCKTCSASLAEAALSQPVTVAQRTGWLSILENAHREVLRKPQSRVYITGPVKEWKYTP